MDWGSTHGLKNFFDALLERLTESIKVEVDAESETFALLNDCKTLLGELAPNRVDHFYGNGNMDPNTSEVIWDSGPGESVVITNLTMRTKSASGAIRITYYDTNGVAREIRHVLGDGRFTDSRFTPGLMEPGNSWFEVFESGDQYVVVLRSGVRLEFPNGVRVQRENRDSEITSVGIEMTVLR